MSRAVSPTSKCQSSFGAKDRPLGPRVREGVGDRDPASEAWGSWPRAPRARASPQGTTSVGVLSMKEFKWTLS